MPDTVRFLSWLREKDNLLKQSVVTGTNLSDAVNYGESNVIELPVSKPIRLNNRAINKIHFSFARAVALNFFAIVAHNLSPSAAITLRGGAAFDAATFSQAITWRRRAAFIILAAQETHQYWSVQIVDDANEHGFIEVGLATAGIYTALTFGYQLDWQFFDREVNVTAESETGTPMFFHLSERQGLRLSFADIGNSDMATVRNFFLDQLGSVSPAFVVPDRNVNEGFFGRFDIAEFARTFPNHALQNTDLAFVEDPAGRTVVSAMPTEKSGESLPSGSTFVRSSVASYKDRDLKLRSAAVDAIRDPHYYADGVAGILLEPARTNSLTQSENLPHADWIKDDVTVTGNDQFAPDGIISADKVVENLVNAEHRVRQGVTVADNTKQAFSFFARASERTWCFARTISKNNTVSYSWVNLATGAKGTISANHVVLVERYTDSWWRILVRWDSEAGGVGVPSVAVGIATGDGVFGYAGDGSSGIWVWGLQFEADQPWPSSYVYTAAAAVTRSIDRLQVPFSFSPQAMTAYLKLVDLGTSKIANSRIFQIAGSSDGSPRWLVFVNGTNFELIHSTSSGSVSSSQAASIPGDTAEIRIHLYPDGSVQLHVSINGAAETSGARSAALALAAAWLATNLRLNQVADGSAGTCLFNVFKIHRGAQTLDFMRKL